MQDVSNYKKIRQDAQNFYQKIGAVHCPAINNELVHFAAEGFNHLVYKGKRCERNRDAQIMKFKLLPKAKALLTIATTYQEYDESLIEIRRERFKKTVQETVPVRY